MKKKEKMEKKREKEINKQWKRVGSDKKEVAQQFRAHEKEVAG